MSNKVLAALKTAAATTELREFDFPDLPADAALMRVEVERGPSWAATTPTLLVKEGYYTTPGAPFLGRTYDIAPDGQRFLMIKERGGTDQIAAPSQVIVVQHWTEELKRLVPTK